MSERMILLQLLLQVQTTVAIPWIIVDDDREATTIALLLTMMSHVPGSGQAADHSLSNEIPEAPCGGAPPGPSLPSSALTITWL